MTISMIRKLKKKEKERETKDDICGSREQINAHIVASEPSEFNGEALNLLRHLRNFSGIIWDADEKIFIYRGLIQKTNIIDIINHIISDRKRVRPC